MSLQNKLKEDMKQAMKNKDKETLSVIRMLRASLQNEAIKLGVDELSADDELSILSRELKQRKDSLEEFKSANREDLVEKLEAEIVVLQSYMPEQLSEEELIEIVQTTIQEVNATSKQDLGKVMGAIMPKVKGKADGALINKLVQKHLE